ncbi:hypothetical protein [Streptomyces sp. NPDC050145]
MQHEWNHDDNERAIPAIPGQRQALPADGWDGSAALKRFPRQDGQQ